LIDLSEIAFRSIAQVLIQGEMSLRDMLTPGIIKVKMLIDEGTVLLSEDVIHPSDKYLQLEAVPVEKFFEPIIAQAGVLLSEEQMGSIIFVAGRQV